MVSTAVISPKANRPAFRRKVIHVPTGEVRRFRTIARTLGVEFEKQNALDEAMEDLVAGRVYQVSSVDELRKRFEFV